MSYLNRSYAPITSEELEALRDSVERLAAERAAADADSLEAVLEAWDTVYSSEGDKHEDSR